MRYQTAIQKKRVVYVLEKHSVRSRVQLSFRPPLYKSLATTKNREFQVRERATRIQLADPIGWLVTFEVMWVLESEGPLT